MDIDVRLANRVCQLEAQSLDGEFNSMIDRVLESLDIPIVAEETKLLLKLYTYVRQMESSSTTGMKVYNLSLFNSNSRNDNLLMDRPQRYKLILLATSNFILPYLLKRYEYLKRHINIKIINQLRLDWLTLENMTMLIKSLNVINFLTFLQEGKYSSLSDRILGIVPGVSVKDYYVNLSVNQVQMETMNRELILKSLAELLTAFIPYLNTYKLKNSIFKVLRPLTGEIMIGNNPRTYPLNCAICNKQPFNPHLIGCKHVFCYYCIHSNHLSDTSVGYLCPSCNFSTKDSTLVQRYKVLSTKTHRSIR